MACFFINASAIQLFAVTLLETVPHMFCNPAPKLLNPAIALIAMSDAIKPYSIAVAPRVLRMMLRMRLPIVEGMASTFVVFSEFPRASNTLAGVNKIE